MLVAPVSFSLFFFNFLSPLLSDSDQTEVLSVDGNSSEQEVEDNDGNEGGGLSQPVPQTPDQEAFLKEHFVTLSDLSGTTALHCMNNTLQC